MIKTLSCIVCVLVINPLLNYTLEGDVLCVHEIDFYNAEYTSLWNQHCVNYGVASSKRVIFNSLFIKCLYQLEKKYTKEFADDSSDCYYLYDKSKGVYLHDLDFTVKEHDLQMVRSLDYAKELTEILALYKKWHDSLGKATMGGNASPLAGSKYCWRKR